MGYDYEIIDSLEMNLMNCEDVWIKIKCKDRNTLLVGSIYRHPCNDVTTFVTKFGQVLDNLSSKEQNYVIGGDFNIDLYKTNTTATNYMNEVKSHGCTQIVENPTRYSHKNTPAILDHIYSNINKEQFKTKILQSDISDHLPILSILEFGNFTTNIKATWKRDFRNFDINKFYNELEELGINLINDEHKTANEVCSMFFTAYEDLINKYAPKRPLSRNKKKRMKRPWIDTNLLKMMKEKNTLYRKFLRNRNRDNNNQYKRIRNKFNHEMAKAK